MRFVKSLSWVVLISLLAVSPAFAFDFVWEPTMSSYQNAEAAGPSDFYALDPLVVSNLGLDPDGGYGTTVADPGIMYSNYKTDGTVAYGGAATSNLSSRGIVNRPGHFYFGFACGYPDSDVFSDYELVGTPLSNNAAAGNACELDLSFRIETTDNINFIGICGADSGTQVSTYSDGGNDYIRIQTSVTDTVYSPTGEGNADTAFGMYINYGQHDEDNVGVDFYGSVFSTNIHWWDIDVPAVPEEGVASIRLSSSSGEKAHVMALVPDAFFTDQGLSPGDVEGYIDGSELPMSAEGDYRYYHDSDNSEDIGVPQDLDLDGVTDPTGRYFVYSDQWSTHDIQIGVIPEPATLALCLCGAAAMLIRKRR